MPFEKGKSGNPGGRPKENKEVKELARKYSKEAIERLVFWMRSNEPRISLQASQALLDRGYGKPSIDSEGSMMNEQIILSLSQDDINIL